MTKGRAANRSAGDESKKNVVEELAEEGQKQIDERMKRRDELRMARRTEGEWREGAIAVSDIGTIDIRLPLDQENQEDELQKRFHMEPGEERAFHMNAGGLVYRVMIRRES